MAVCSCCCKQVIDSSPRNAAPTTRINHTLRADAALQRAPTTTTTTLKVKCFAAPAAVNAQKDTH